MGEIEYRQIKDGHIHHWGYIENGGFVSPMATSEWHDVISEQYTGFKDDNGTKVFAGDIVLVRGIIYRVEFDDYKFMLTSRFQAEYVMDLIEAEDSIEVIGNISQNPELLKLSGANTRDDV
jgi:hypothetical protein